MASYEPKLSSLYMEAKAALKLVNESELPKGQLYALECIAEDKKIEIHSFPQSMIKKNTDIEKHAAYHLSKPVYMNLSKEDAKKEYVSFAKMLLYHKQNNIFFANKILNDKTISSSPNVTKF